MAEDINQWELPYTVVGSVNWCKTTLENQQFPIMLNIYKSYNPVVPFLGIYPREINDVLNNFIHSIKSWKGVHHQEDG